MSRYSIKDLEKVSGVKAHTIRIWEKRYKLIEPKRTDTNIRYYCDTDLKKLLNISILSKCGYRISIIAKLSNVELGEKVMELTRDLNISDHSIENLVISMVEMDEEKFEKTLAKSILKYGFEQTYIQTIYPLYQKVGLLWQTGSITPVHEHFISNLLRQKLIVAIDNLDFKSQNGNQTFVLFLPENEMHELGLLFFYYLIKKKGHKVIYLGQSVPQADLFKSIRALKPDCLFTSFVKSVSGKELNTYFDEFNKSFPLMTMYVSLNHSFENTLKPPQNIRIITNGNDFKIILDNIALHKSDKTDFLI